MLFRRLAMPLVAALVLVTGTSCFDILETIRLDKDGSGEYVLDLDMSEALQLLSGFMAMDTSNSEMAQAMEEVMDSTMRFADAPDSARMAWRYPEITARATMNVRLDGPAETLTMSVRLPFDRPEDIDRFGADLANTDDLGLMDALSGGGSDDGQGGAPPMLSGEDQFRSAKGRITRRAVDASGLLGGSDDDEESMDMMKMFLSGATYTVVYELPGKVNKVSADDVTVEGNRVTMERDLLELMEGDTDLSIDIRYQ
jgi:hypothetical protein